MSYETIITEKRGRVGVITLNRPKALNALNGILIKELCDALEHYDADCAIGAIVLTGNDRAFAAGADIKEMQEKTFPESYRDNFLAILDRVGHVRTPIIAAISGYALGGGCELAMMCDIIIAGKSAKFGQPEIVLGVIPGAGGSQRMTRSIGKAKTMDMVLTGRMMDAQEAERCGLVSRIVEDDMILDTAFEIGETIAKFSLPSVLMAKEAVNAAFETSLHEGLHLEKRLFHSLFATEDQKEGMAAFIEKRQAQFRHR